MAMFIRPHGILMPNGLHSIAAMGYLFFLLSLLTPNLWDHWTDLNQTWTPIHLWLLFEKFVPNSPGIYPHGLEAKTAFGDRL